MNFNIYLQLLIKKLLLKRFFDAIFTKIMVLDVNCRALIVLMFVKYLNV